jgi:hypothetical protein
VTFVHIEGHLADGGNDRADLLVQWGKTDGPYNRILEVRGANVPIPGGWLTDYVT